MAAYIGKQGCTDASQVGATLGVGLVIRLWVVTDMILGIGRWIVLTSRRRSS
jgi:hypothetical protein